MNKKRGINKNDEIYKSNPSKFIIDLQIRRRSEIIRVKKLNE